MKLKFHVSKKLSEIYCSARWFMHRAWDTVWRNIVQSGLNVACCCREENARKDREMIQINAMKTKNIKTVISVQAFQRPLFCGVLAQLLRVSFKRQMGRDGEWKVRLEKKITHPPPASSSIQHMTGIFRAVSSLNLSAGWFDLRVYAV